MDLTKSKIFESKKILIPFILLYTLILFISAWLSDDAYITFRTVDNFINGYGLTWNVSERVQAYTHPLWMFLISGFYFFTREIYFTTIGISILISVIAIILIITKISESIFNSILVLLILTLSKAFIDYSTSGLENPLTHLLLVLFFIIYLRENEGERKIMAKRDPTCGIFLLSLIASLTVLNRMDIILLLLPSIVYMLFKEKKLKNIFTGLLGFIPFFIWEIFSLFYYGFLYPNTAYAKLSTGISKIELIQQGLTYLLNSIYLDPLTPIIILIGISVPFFTKNKRLIPLSIGIVLYLIYVINIGGDFMSSRFLSASLVCSVLILSTAEILSVKKLVFALTSVIILGILSPKPTIFYNKNYGLGPKIVKAFRFGPLIPQMQDGIADERLFYYQWTGLLKNFPKENFSSVSRVKAAKEIRTRGDRALINTLIGILGYEAGPGIHIIDPWALSDPLLSKLPSTEYWRFGSIQPAGDRKWRIGHFTRKIPDGYFETINLGVNKIQDPDLRKYYDKLSIIIKGDIWSLDRIKEIWKMNTLQYNYLLDEYNKTLTLNDK